MYNLWEILYYIFKVFNLANFFYQHLKKITYFNSNYFVKAQNLLKYLENYTIYIGNDNINIWWK